VKVDEVKLRAVMAMVQILSPQLKTPVNAENRTKLINWAVDNFNSLKLLFGEPLIFDYDAMEKGFLDAAKKQEELQDQEAEQSDLKEPRQPRPFAMLDDVSTIIKDISSEREKRMKVIQDRRNARTRNLR
jgi:hypothetical protein